MENEKYEVIKDTREQQGWWFSASPHCTGTVVGTLKTGDYTLRGFEDILVIERKQSTAEFSQNVVQDRFERELERMEGFTLPFVICEFTYHDLMNFPKGSGIPTAKWKSLRVTSHFLLKRLTEFEIKYRAKFILAGAFGKEVASSIFKRVLEWQKPNKK